MKKYPKAIKIDKNSHYHAKVFLGPYLSVDFNITAIKLYYVEQKTIKTNIRTINSDTASTPSIDFVCQIYASVKF